MNSSQPKKRGRHFPGSPGFTLIELLFVIAIIAVLSTMSLGIMRSAQEDAKESATQARIKAIEAILQIEMEDYEVRRLPISLSRLKAYAAANPVRTGGAELGVQVRNLKRRIVADMISSEFPRPLLASGNFVFNNDVGKFPTEQIPLDSTQPSPMGFRAWLDAKYPNGSPSLSILLNSVRSAKVRSWQAILSRRDPPNDIEFDLPGEYLYETLVRIDFDGAPAVEQLGSRAIGDSDGDGFLEVVDSWGAPMQLRIWQVDAREVDGAGEPMPGTDIWDDDPNTNFDIADVSGAPTGYAVIDPTVPREVNQIRFQVVSTRLPF